MIEMIARHNTARGPLERLLGALDWLAERRGRIRMPPHLRVGWAGEDVAFHNLRAKGYHVVARRWNTSGLPGDIDLIAWQGEMLCFIEVKTRSVRDYTPAEAAVDTHKRLTLMRLARRYVRLLRRETPPPVRFDVMSVYLTPGNQRSIDHFEAAIPWSKPR